MNKILCVIFLFTTFLYSESANIVSAANMKFVFEDLMEEYSKKYPNDKFKIEFNSSGKIVNDIINGRQYDLFLSANMDYPSKLYNLNLSATKPTLYATGGLILLLSDNKDLKVKRLKILTQSNIKEITIANNKTAPYGMATIEALKNANIYEKIKDKILYSTDASSVIGDVLWYGHAGILPKSAISVLPRGYNHEGINYIEIDKSLYTPIKQGFVFSKSGIDNNVAKRFVEFLLSTKGKEMLKQNGYN